MNEQCIQVKNLTKSFSGRKVINELSFEVNKGEVFALLGHNGQEKVLNIQKVSIGCFDDILISVIILLVIAVICTSVSVKTFRWE